jgi:phosphohistidine phosphatase
LVRARQTAEILLAAGLSPRLEVASTLAPGGSFSQWLTWLDEWRQAGHESLALVGHQPDLSQWAELLLWGEARSALILKKAGIIGITLPAAEPPIGSSQLFWLAPPKLLL